MGLNILNQVERNRDQIKKGLYIQLIGFKVYTRILWVQFKLKFKEVQRAQPIGFSQSRFRAVKVKNLKNTNEKKCKPIK